MNSIIVCNLVPFIEIEYMQSQTLVVESVMCVPLNFHYSERLSLCYHET